MGYDFTQDEIKNVESRLLKYADDICYKNLEDDINIINDDEDDFTLQHPIEFHSSSPTSVKEILDSLSDFISEY